MNLASAPLKVSPGNAPGSLVLSGTLDFTTAALVFAQSAQWLHTDTCELDLSGVRNADSAALAMLVVWAAQAQQRGIKLRYRHAPQGLHALAQSCDIDSLLDINSD